MNLDRFEAAARDAFAFLEDEYGLVHVPDDPAERTRHWWARHLTYGSDRAFVRVELDDRDRVFNVLFGPTRSGEIPPYPTFLEREEEPIEWFPLWAVLHARGISAPEFSFAEDDRLDRELAAWADALRAEAGSALLGERDFAELDEPVRQAKLEGMSDR
jgi:hypothetical protein